jgi:hypothetical protein
MRCLWRTIALSAVLLFLATPSNVYAAYASVLGGSTATLIGDGADDTLIITQSGGLFRHNRFTAGDFAFASDFDFDSLTAGEQTLSSATGTINIFAGDGNDTITIGDGVDLRGVINGSVGIDTLNYSGFTTAVRANLGLGTTGLGATLGADQENPPTSHTGTATATVSNYDVTARTFDITVTVTGLLPADVTGFHIHQGAVGVNGPIIVDFTGVAPLVPAGSGFTFTKTGLVLPAASEAAFLGGGTYVNIHTAAFPGGAIRGQLFSTGNVNLLNGGGDVIGVATGTSSILNIENVTGGAGNDSLVGSFLVNTINGGPGADWIVGGPGSDVLNGDAGADVIVWSNGDGSDVVEGGPDTDTVQVNGSTAAADIFLVSANGIRLRFDRTNLGLFNLDVGTVETLSVNGIGGDDTFTVNNLTGVAALATINLYGFEGNDTFTFVPTSAGPVVFNAHGGPGTDTLQGPNSATTWNVTGPNQGNIVGLVASFSFIEALSGGTGNDIFNVTGFAGGTPMTVAGGDGTDSLNYDARSRAVSGDTTPPDGAIDSTGVQSIIFTTIETLNIINPQPVLAINNVTVAEGGPPTSAVFNVALSNPSLMTVTVSFATANGTATSPGDYTAQAGTLVFAPGELLKTIVVPITVDGIPEPTETFFVNLTGALNSRVAVPQGLGTITDPDVVAAVSNDYDGDRKADLVVFRPTTGTWYTRSSSTGFTAGALRLFGLEGDVIVPGDYDRDGQVDLGVFRPANGTWFIQQSSTATLVTYALGIGTDIPVPGDYDGDQKTDPAVYRPSTGVWSVLKSSSGYTATQTFALGASTDIPVPADYDGDGITDAAVYHPSTGVWTVATARNGFATSFTVQWGIIGDLPVPGDYDGDGVADVAVYRPGSGMWFILQSTTGYTTSVGFQFGLGTDITVPGDYDGDGKTDLALFRPNSGNWYIALSTTGYTTAVVYQWGLPGDVPAPNATVVSATTISRRTVAKLMRTADLDGDGRADLNVYRPSTGTWYNLQSKANYTLFGTYQWGLAGDVPASSDYDGDGTTDLAVWRPSIGGWFIRQSSTNFVTSSFFQWGLPGDVPVPGDYDGDGLADLAVWRPANGTWYIRLSSTGYVVNESFQWGLPGDVPVPGDYDNDGVTDLAVWRPSSGTWFIRQSTTGYATSVNFQWGLNSDIAVPSDYDGDGVTDLAVWRPSSGTWFIRNSRSGYATSAAIQWGISGDTPVPADFDGDGKTDLVVYRENGSVWFILKSVTNYGAAAAVQWGLPGDIPILPRR